MSWIKVEDRIPDKFKDVLVAAIVEPTNKESFISVFVAFHLKGEWDETVPPVVEFGSNYFEGSWKVTHWQPLPEPPKV